MSADPTKPCRHNSWRIFGSEQIGYATCLDCGNMIGIDDAFNRLRERMEEAIKAAEDALHSGLSREKNAGA